MEETPKDTEFPRVTRYGNGPRQNGLAIRAIREKDGWTQTKFAAAVGIAQGTLSAIERELDNASVPVLNVIARTLAIPVGAITRGREAAGAARPDGEAPAEAA